MSEQPADRGPSSGQAFAHAVVLLSPPRSASTALARVMWAQPEIDFYCHEPYERAYLDGATPTVSEALASPLALATILPGKRRVAPRQGGLLVKEITFQLGAAFPQLCALTRRPIVFLIRDPRLSISSRMAALERYRGRRAFAPRESGFTDLAAQIAEARRRRLPYVVVNATDLRRRPLALLPELFGRLGLSFSADQLRWEPLPELDLARLRGAGDPFFTRVLASRALEPPDETVPPRRDFPPPLREHLDEALAIYRRLLDDPCRIAVS